jgi:hypothetical protein
MKCGNSAFNAQGSRRFEKPQILLGVEKISFLFLSQGIYFLDFHSCKKLTQ